MSAQQLPKPHRAIRLLLPAAVLYAAGAVGFAALAPWSPATLPDRPAAEPAEATPAQVHQMCGTACHKYPPPDSFPRSAWRAEVKQGFDFFHKDPTRRLDFPPLEAVVRYYENRAPEELPALPPTRAAGEPPCRFERRGVRLPGRSAAAAVPSVAHVSLVRLGNDRQPTLLVCDALNEQVLTLTGLDKTPTWRVLARGLCCAHAEVVDLDGDGIPDIVLACLGNFFATDERVGSVVWLKGRPDGTFTPITLLDGVGRVADVRAADFTGSGKLDLVVGVFGWRQTGEVLLLENRTTDWSKPLFTPHVLDDRHGTTHVPVADLNGDGRPDFVALISQEHETVVAFLNEGGGRFRKEVIYEAPHPAFGSNGIQLVDLDGDGDLDVLYTNGDSLDAPYLLKPYHGVQWLENRGTFPFTYHRLADVYGAGSPVAADFNGDGRLDIVVVSFLPAAVFPQRAERRLDSVVLLEQTAPGRFVRHALETVTCDHLTCAVGDVDGDGRPDLIVGNFFRGGRPADAVTVWKNLAARQP
jgi:hypothetical protein